MNISMKKSAGLLCVAALAILAGCAAPREYDHRPVLLDASFSDLDGWENDDHLAAMNMFAQSCDRAIKRHPSFTNKSGQNIGSPTAWRLACHEAKNNNFADAVAARLWFEQHFKPYRVTTRYSEYGRLTGYYEPVIFGSRTKTPEFRVPVYGVPYNHKLPSYSRAQIDAGALKGKAPELLYVNDAVMLFFLQIQGSGKVQLPDGNFVSLQYASKNGHGYVPIGRVLVDRNELEKETLSLQTIRDWLYRHPHQAAEVMQQNPSYVFFKLAPGDQYPKGALGISLTPERSLAIDDDQAVYGLPVYVVAEVGQGQPFERLMIAQDTGGAILGAHRGDIFFGRGKKAEFLAGYQNTLGEVYWLLPKH